MIKAWLNKFWQFGLTNSLIISSAIALSEVSVAQVQPDSTLGSESSIVNSVDENIDLIRGGAIRGTNLLHSFQEFNIGEGKAVYFANPQGIENIFNRVTGNNPSQILGRLGVLGNANLYLLNPNGIIFGKNASLDVNGSFVATTAESILFQNGQEFSATNPQKPILEIKVPFGLQIGNTPGAIINQSVTLNSTSTAFVGLQVQPGKNLSLIGGDVSLAGGFIFAPGGRVELGGLSKPGIIDINSDGSLSFPENVERGNVFLNQGASVGVYAGGGGAIAINSKNLELREGSRLYAGIAPGQGSPEAQAGDIVINASDKVTFDGISQNIFPSGISNSIFDQGVGNTGNIKITTGELSLTNGGSIISSVFGQGNAGNITINASKKVSFDGTFSGINNSIFDQGIGNTGNIKITTGELSLTNEAILLARLYGKGKTGDIEINANNNIVLDGNITTIANFIILTGTGSTGNINISARNLSLTNGGTVASYNQGQGVSGNIAINTSDTIFISGELQGTFSKISSFVDATGVGNAGAIEIDTKNLVITNGGTIGSFVAGNGNSGDITINASDTIFLDGEANNLRTISPSSINTFVVGTGNSGNVNISTKNLLVTNGGYIAANIFGRGNAGNIKITDVKRIIIDGKSLSGLASGIYSSVLIDAIGNGGKIEISTTSLELTNGSSINSFSAGKGNGGDIRIEAKEIILEGDTIIDSGVFGTEQGNGGEIEIKAAEISFNNGAGLSTEAFGVGNAGNIKVSADSFTLDRDSSIYATNIPLTEVSNNLSGGNVTLQISDRLILRNNSDISTQAFSNANGGNIEITAGAVIAFDDSDIFAYAEAGRGGNITLNTPAYFGNRFTANSLNANPDLLDNNDRADINATGAVSGVVTIPDVSFLQNSLTELPENTIDTNALVASSCIARSDRGGTFTITGTGNLPNRPGDAAVSPYPTGDVRGVESDRTSTHRSWKIGDPIIEPQAAYRLGNGQIVLSRECGK